MATKDKLRNDIKKLKEFLAKPSTPASAKDKIKAQIKKIEKELSAKKPTKTVATTVATTKVMLGKLQKFVKKNPKYGGYSGTSESNLKKDAVRNALKIGRRTSEGKRSNQYGSKSDNKGNVYYEYRSNRLDVKQPRAKQKFPILEDGGEIASMSEKDFINKYFGANVFTEDVSKYFDIKTISSSNDAKIEKFIEDYKRDGYTIKKKSYSDFKSVMAVKKKMANGGYMAGGGKLDAGVYRVGKPKKVSPNLYEQKIVEIFDNGSISTASDYGRRLSDFKSQKYPIISSEQLAEQYKMGDGGYMANGGDTDGKNGYIAFYKGKRAEVYANTSYEAQLKAAKMFNAKKSYDVHVVLAEKDGVPVTHSTSSMAKGGKLKSLKEKFSNLNYQIQAADTGWIKNNPDEYRKMKDELHELHEKIEEQERKGGYMESGGKLEVGDVVANKKHKTIGIVREIFDKGEVKTDADGMVDADDLEVINKNFYKGSSIYRRKYDNYHIAPSTKIEIEKMAMGGVTEHGLMVGDYILRISGSEKRMTVQNGKQLFHVNITTGERKKYMEDGGAINVLGDTAGADLQSVGGTMYSSADLTDHLTIENTGFFKGGGVLSKTHRRNS